MRIKKIFKTVVAASALVYATHSQNVLAQAIDNALNAKKPNFVIILFDDMGFSELGAFGSEIPTPNLDQLAAQGITFTNFYASPTSTPSRTMLFTGKDAHKVGAGNMKGWQRPEQKDKNGEFTEHYLGDLSPKALPVFELLKDSYHNMYSGKWDLGFAKDEISPAGERKFLLAHEFLPLNRGLHQDFVLMPGGDTNLLSDAQGNVVTTYTDALKEMSDPLTGIVGRVSPYDENGKEFKDFPPNAFSATFYTDKAIEMMEKRDKNKPFFMTLAYFTPHDPFQAPAEAIAKHLPTYERGWDVIRQERFEKQKQLGLWPQSAQLPPRAEEVPAWDSLTPGQRKVEAKRMAIDAAMVDISDQQVGRFIQYLKDIGEYENTVFFVLSDNGASAHSTGKNGAYPEEYEEESYNLMGTTHEFKVGSSPGWGMVMNTPLNKYKADTFDGGVRVTAFATYPKSKWSGVIYDGLRSIMDITPTMLEMAEVNYPTTYQGRANSPMEGISFANLFKGHFTYDPDRMIAWEVNGCKGLRRGNWKLSQYKINHEGRYDEKWHLFNLALDPYEEDDLAEREPVKLVEMMNAFNEYAENNDVKNVSGKILVGGLGGKTHDGSETSTVFVGGTSVNYGNFRPNATVTAPSDVVEIEFDIHPEMEHVGLLADIFVKADYYATADAKQPTASWALIQQGNVVGVVDWANPQGNPPAFFQRDMRLLERHPVSVYAGNLTLPGKITVSIGYQLQDGRRVESAKSININIK